MDQMTHEMCVMWKGLLVEDKLAENSNPTHYSAPAHPALATSGCSILQ